MKRSTPLKPGKGFKRPSLVEVREKQAEKRQNRPVSSLRRRTPDTASRGLNASQGLNAAKSRLSRRTKPLRTKPRKGRGKLPSFKWLKNRLDILTSQIVRLRDGRCVLCGTSERLQCGHIFGRRSHGARWDIEPDGNCHGQCSGCNQRHNYEPLRFYRWFIQKFGQEKFDELYARWQKGRKFTRLELVNLVAEYESRLVAMNNGA